jgi:FAD/FMN-containing dehydrogenase
MVETADFVAALGDIPLTTDAAEVRLRSRDNFAVSPLLRQALAGKAADLVVAPRDRADLIRVIQAAVRHHVPLVPRGAGTANYGQSVPLSGGALLDLTGLAGIVWQRPGAVRCQGGTRMLALDEELRPSGWELRIHPSTRKASTVAGFIAGGSGGMGSCAWGMLRDQGNITALEVLSIEAEPRTIELRGRDVDLVHHAYGTNGIITELELPTTPAWPWREVVLGFPDYAHAIRFGVQLAHEPGILKKLISVHEWPAPGMMRALGGIVPEGMTAVFAMLAPLTRDAADDLMREFDGRVLSDAAEGENPFGPPLYEFSYGHGLRQIQRSHPRATVLQSMFPADDLVGALERAHARLAEAGPMRSEIFLSEGRVVALGSPYVTYESDAQMAAYAEALQAEGAMIANSHATGLRGVGIKAIGPRDLAFKREMDPHRLLNPGKMEDAEDAPAGPAPRLAVSGWRFRRAG